MAFNVACLFRSTANRNNTQKFRKTSDSHLGLQQMDFLPTFLSERTTQLLWGDDFSPEAGIPSTMRFRKRLNGRTIMRTGRHSSTVFLPRLAGVWKEDSQLPWRLATTFQSPHGYEWLCWVPHTPRLAFLLFQQRRLQHQTAYISTSIRMKQS